MVPKKHHALIVAFDDEHITDAVSHLYGTLQDKLQWEVSGVPLPTTSSGDAQVEFERSIQPFLTKAQSSPDNKIIIFLYGYTFNNNESGETDNESGTESDDSEEYETATRVWEICATPTQPTCREHIVSIDPSIIFNHLKEQVPQDVLFIMPNAKRKADQKSKGDFAYGVSFEAEPYRKNRSVQIINLRGNTPIKDSSQACHVQAAKHDQTVLLPPDPSIQEIVSVEFANLLKRSLDQSPHEVGLLELVSGLAVGGGTQVQASIISKLGKTSDFMLGRG